MELRARTKGVVAKSSLDNDSQNDEWRLGMGSENSITRRTRRLPMPVRFPLVVVLSFAISALSYSLLGELTNGELAEVSKSLDSWAEVSMITGWRMYGTQLTTWLIQRWVDEILMSRTGSNITNAKYLI